MLQKTEIKADGVTLEWQGGTHFMYLLGQELGHEYVTETVERLQSALQKDKERGIRNDALNVFRAIIVAGAKAANPLQLAQFDDSVFWEMAADPDVIGQLMDAVGDKTKQKKKNIIQKMFSK
jgi:hypothetical protein